MAAAVRHTPQLPAALLLPGVASVTRTRQWTSLDPDARFVTGLLGAQGIFEVDPAPVGDGDQQDERVGGFVADTGDAPAGVLPGS